MTLDKIIKINDTLGFLIYSKLLYIDNYNLSYNQDIRYTEDNYYYDFYCFKQADDKINYTIVNLVNVEKQECNILYNKYIRYKKLLNIDLT
jgi:hypothetical protein